MMSRSWIKQATTPSGWLSTISTQRLSIGSYYGDASVPSYKKHQNRTAAPLAAFYHPLRLAEELAPVDNLWDVLTSALRGFDQTEMGAFGVFTRNLL